MSNAQFLCLIGVLILLACQKIEDEFLGALMFLVGAVLLVAALVQALT